MPLEKPIILVVEDDADNADLIQEQLKSIGYPASSLASTALDALRRVKQQAPDLILMDICLPGMDGLEAVRKLKADPSTRNIPVLAVTAKAMPSDREMCLQSGCDGYLSKPYFPSALKAEVEKLLKVSDG